MTFIVDKEGIIRSVEVVAWSTTGFADCWCRDALDATVNYGAHQKFVDKWFQKLEGESATAES